MRIVAGSARGRTLEAPDGSTTRPTSDRVREALFNSLFSLGAIEEARVLDLFAGSGALGLEALSRGASHCTFVDQSRPAIAAIEANVEACGFEGQATVVSADALGWLERSPLAATAFDLVVCDPPYTFAEWDRVLDHVNAAVLVIESDREVAAHPRWSALRSKRYGSTIVTTLVPSVSDHDVVCESVED